MSWRPKDWDAIKSELEWEPMTTGDAIEAGADAMLEALREEGHGRARQTILHHGYWVFIPDEEDEMSEA